MTNLSITQSNQEKSYFKLILKSEEFPLISDFPYISDVNPTIYSQLLSDHRYFIKSNVKKEVVQSFINHWVNREIPDINVTNITDYIQLSQEFDRMTDLVKMFLNHTSNVSISTLLHKAKKLKKRIKSRNKVIQLFDKNYNSLIDSFFNSDGIKTTQEFNEFKSKLFKASLKSEFNSNDISSEKVLNVNGIQYLLNEKEKTAGVLEVFSFESYIFIPRSVIYDSEEFLVTKILENSFCEDQIVTTIEFPEDSELKEIEKNAFLNSQIETIEIPKHVTKICESAFSYCNSLFEVTFCEGSELKTIEKDAFFYSFIDTLFIPSSVEELKKGWCSGMNSLYTIVVVPNDKENVTLYDDKLLLGKSFLDSDEFDILLLACRDVEEVKVPSFVKRIAPHAFSGCESLETLEFSEHSQLQIIEELAFAYSALTTIDIPPQVTSIESEAFLCCSSLKVVTFSEDSELKSIGKFAFSESSIEKLVIPSSVIVFGKAWCNGTENLTEIEIIRNQRENVILYNNEILVGKSNLESPDFDVLLFARRDIEKVTIPSFIKIIDSFSFDSCNMLNQISFADNSKLQIIGNSAFYNCCFDAITIPSQVVEMRKRSFQCCNKLERIEFDHHSELKRIGKYVFAHSSIQTISIPSKVEDIGASWCFNANFLETVKIGPNNQNFIQNGPFTINKSESGNFDTINLVNKNVILTKIPAFIRKIDSYSFTNCHKLKTVEFEKDSKLELIGENAFESSSIIEVSIPPHVKSIKKYAFSDCASLESVTFSNDSKLRFIFPFAFYRTGIKEVIFPSSLVHIGAFAFSHCHELQIVEIPENSELAYINSDAFNKSPVIFVMIPAKLINLASLLGE
ncbi:hypothetical protein M9Y10_020924 [Tritrichomonas musculus]|uniref:Surface antigen BspA-like n=1 Tax=Tritrichomonas musculus TaxID=1915356 RepID=A0ABR2HF07_9EUKA